MSAVWRRAGQLLIGGVSLWEAFAQARREQAPADPELGSAAVRVATSDGHHAAWEGPVSLVEARRGTVRHPDGRLELDGTLTVAVTFSEPDLADGAGWID